MTKKMMHLVLIAWLLLLNVDVRAQQSQSYDIVIYGATSAGIIAGYTALKMGKTAVVIGTDEHIGGLSSGGLGQTDIGNKAAIGGLSRRFYQDLGQYYGKAESWTFEPKVAGSMFEKYIQEVQLPIIKNQRIGKVKKKKGTITAVLLYPTYGKGKATQEITGKVFLDCTYEGDLIALAGVPFMLGREDNSQFKETLNGFQLPTYQKQSGWHQFPDHVSPYKTIGDPQSGLLWGISKDKPSRVGTGDKRIQAYNFRICLTDSAENRIPIERPTNYDPQKYELLGRLIEAQPQYTMVKNYFIWSKMPNRKTDINNRGGFSTDMIGANYDWATASFDRRKAIYNEHLEYTIGYLYFMQTDPRVPEHIRSYVKNWGLPKDEYVNNGHFTPQLYIREGRRMLGAYVMSEHNCTGKETAIDPIGLAAYTMDSHNTQRIIVDGMVKNEGNVEVGKFSPYQIAYNSITPKERDCTNLLVPVCLSSTHIAFGSIRMEPVFMILGESAAVAAVQAIEQKKSVQKIDRGQLREELLRRQQILEWKKN
ncbi:FAD-dependent oxidoreductase [Sphingobacterium faecale]|uniref:FAD-dependent oxidoreductase n=1 Tax=Sphingobacterium faecale TaxID=2803775 RepID=A0ABS1R6Q3_9SPHI|nr:FAD-dependent oxidoreductase [Sphingobacterium faecale]MBL1410387.1 FAD-dependent oxidoreductase [Sphingobacterium faecale]